MCALGAPRGELEPPRQDKSPGQRGCKCVSEGGLEPPRPFGALAPQASASAYSATRTSGPRAVPPATSAAATLAKEEGASDGQPLAYPVDQRAERREGSEGPSSSGECCPG